MTIPPEYLNQIVTGDARELAKRIPDNSIDLIFTDPPYIGDVLPLYEWLGKEGYRVLKPNGALLCYFGTGFMPQVLSALTANGLTYRWTLDVKWAGLPVFYGKIAVTKQSCLWVEKGHSNPAEMVKDSWIVSQVSKSTTKYYVDSESNWADGQASWGKNAEASVKWIRAFTCEDSVILDPFCGMGTTAVAALESGRNYIAFEIDAATADKARERVTNAQPPLFVTQPRQADMDI